MLSELELQLQHLDPDRAAKHPDAVHELLLRLGDLSRDEIAARTIPGAHINEWLEDLVRERRIVGLRVANEPRFIAAEDSAKYRDALGAVIPVGIGLYLATVTVAFGGVVWPVHLWVGAIVLSALAGIAASWAIVPPRLAPEIAG